MKNSDSDTTKLKITFNELGMAEICDPALLELIAGGVAKDDSMSLADNCTCGGNQNCQTGH